MWEGSQSSSARARGGGEGEGWKEEKEKDVKKLDEEKKRGEGGGGGGGGTDKGEVRKRELFGDVKFILVSHILLLGSLASSFLKPAHQKPQIFPSSILDPLPTT